MRTIFLIISHLLLFSLPFYSQSSEVLIRIDSLEKAITLLPEDSNKVKSLRLLAQLSYETDEVKGIEVFEQALQLAEELSWTRGMINLTADLGKRHFQVNNPLLGSDYYQRHFQAIRDQIKENGNLESDQKKLANRFKSIGFSLMDMAAHKDALSYADSGLLLSKTLKDTSIISECLRLKSVISRHQGNYEQAMELLIEALDYAEKAGRKRNESVILNDLGIIYGIKNDTAAMLSAYEKAISIGRDLEYYNIVASANTNLANFYINQQNYTQAERFIKEALAFFISNDSPVRTAICYGNLGSLYGEQGNYAQAINYLNKAIELAEKTGSWDVKSTFLDELGLTYRRLGRFEEAISYLKKALQVNNQFGLTSLRIDNLNHISETYELMGQGQAALVAFKAFIAARDSVFNADNTKKMAELDLGYRFKKKQLADSLSNVQRITEIELSNQQALSRRNYLLFSSLGLAIIALLYIRSRQQARNRENELQLRQEQARKAQLQELDSLKSRFFANISHEFRTPLTLILGPASDLYRQATTKPFRTGLGMIQTNARRLLRLVNQILDLSKLESGKFALQIVEADIVAFVRRIVASFESATETAGLQLEFKTELSNLSMPFDPDILEKTLVNLLGNALKYTPKPGRISVSMWEARSADTGNRIYLQITDTGIGIPTEHLPHVFDRFYQAATDNYTTQQASTGIGLALVKELIELHGGSITATSTPRQGSNFTFWLPAAPENYQAEDFVPDKHLEHLGPELSSLAMGEMLASSSAANQKDKASLPLILLIEDNSEVRAYLHSCLQDSYQILEAENGAVGIDLAIEQIPDLIITDVMMPEKDGFTVTQELKQDPLTNHIPIIILTGKSSQESKLEGLETEAEAFLTKPFDAEELRLRVQGLLNNRTRLQEKFSRRLLLESGLVEVTSSDEAFLNEAAAIVEANLGDENFSIEKLAEALNISRSQAFRKIKALTDQSPSRFTRSIRLKRAKQLIEGRAGTIAEIAYSMGFSSPTYFSKCFKEQYGLLPGEL